MQGGILDDGDILGYLDERPASFAVNSVGHFWGLSWQERLYPPVAWLCPELPPSEWKKSRSA